MQIMIQFQEITAVTQTDRTNQVPTSYLPPIQSQLYSKMLGIPCKGLASLLDTLDPFSSPTAPMQGLSATFTFAQS